jgi:hypothetical protein
VLNADVMALMALTIAPFVAKRRGMHEECAHFICLDPTRLRTKSRDKGNHVTAAMTACALKRMP